MTMRLVPLSLLLQLLFFLVIMASCAADEVVSSSSEEVDDDDALVCDVPFDICLGSCWKSGECLRCCKRHGFVHGTCSIKHGDTCYCCDTPDDPNHK